MGIEIKVNVDNIEQQMRDFHKSFKCNGCGECCKRGFGVQLIPGETQIIKRLVKETLGISWPEFREAHTYLLRAPDGTNGTRCLKLPCAFLKDNKCLIYKQRPQICRLFPMTKVTPEGKLYISNLCPPETRSI